MLRSTHQRVLAERTAVLESQIDRLQTEAERWRQDFNSVVTMLGGQAARNTSTPLFDRDPFDEIAGPTTYLSPAPEELEEIDFNSVMDEVTAPTNG